jgi:hypothetical protein
MGTAAAAAKYSRCWLLLFLQDMRERGVAVDWTRLQWAVQVLQSRCFFEATLQQHLAGGLGGLCCPA